MDDWMALMRRGAWSQAWALADAAPPPRDWTLPRHLQRVWDGSPLAGRRVLVRCYHGLGDTVQFIRLVAPLRAIARDVTVWAQPALIPLLATMRDAPRLLPLHDGTPDEEYDVDIELMELAHALRLTPGTLPARVPYMHPPAPPPRRDDALHVGLVWRAGDWDARRSVPFELLRPLRDIAGVTLHILQRGPGLAERPPGFGIASGSDVPLETATLMRGLDLVVSVDSFPAHLAGALGLPVLLLLAEPADWRWMEGREDSPWYPTMRLLRQRRPGDWSAPLRAVLERVAAR